MFISRPMRRRQWLASACLFSCLPALAAGFPDKPVKLTVGFASGGAADIVARQLGAKLTEQTGQQFLVDNRPGATGTIAAAGVAKSSADGYTLMLASQSTMVVSPAMYAKLSFDPIKDFVPITQLVTLPMLLVVHPSVKAKTLPELLALIKAGSLSYASSGLGGPQHMAAELFEHLTKTKLNHVPYKGEAPAISDVIGGQIPVMFANLPAALPHVAAGRLRALAVTTTRRLPSLPEVPAVAETAGLSDFEVLTWYGLFAPSGTPADVVRKLQDESVKALRSKDLSAKLTEQGYSVVATSSEQFGAFVKAEVPRWAKLIKDADIKAD